MPNVVKTPEDHEKWERAKVIVNSSIRDSKSALKNVRKDSDRYWKLIMGAYKALRAGRIK